MHDTEKDIPTTSAVGDVEIPALLYHATPRWRWERIREEGLVPSDASHRGRPPGVYLATQEGVSRNYVEMGFGEEGDCDWVVLSIRSEDLDPSCFVADVGHETQTTFEEDEWPGFTIRDVWDARIPWWVSAGCSGQVVYEGHVPVSALTLVAEVPAAVPRPGP